MKPVATDEDNSADVTDVPAVLARPCPSGINPEAWAYWVPICAAMDPLTSDEIVDVALVLNRAAARRAARLEVEQ